MLLLCLNEEQFKEVKLKCKCLALLSGIGDIYLTSSLFYQ